MRCRLAIVALGLVINAPAFASEWLEISSDDRARISIDRSSIERKGSRVTYWMRTDIWSASLRMAGEDYTVNQWTTDCAERQAKIRASFGYTQDGLVKWSVETPASKEVSQLIAPDTVGEKIFELLCKKR